MIQRTLLLLIVSAVPWIAGCRESNGGGSAKTEPAHVEHAIEETALNTITLTPHAVERLGIRLAEVTKASLRRRRTIGGEVTLPPGQTISVSAPIAGTLNNPPGQTAPMAGSRLTRGDAVFTFIPLLTPERDVLTPSERVRVAQTRAQVATAQLLSSRQIESAKITVEAAQIVYDRAVKLLEDRAGSRRQVEEAEANLRIAKEALTTARERAQFLSSIKLDETAGTLEPRVIKSPVSGVLQQVSAAAGETVAVGELLFSVIKTSQVWIRVPVYAGERSYVADGEPAIVTELGDRRDTKSQQALRVEAPPSADAISATVDVYYELDNKDGRLYPGQRVAVTIPLKGQATNLAVPFAAILYDVQGGAWVYEETKSHTYARRRVSIDYVDDDMAILLRGPPPGTKVVIEGAPELFGTEFGVGH